MRYLLAAAALLLLPLAAASEAAPRNARCVISSSGEATYRGPCRFLAEKGGSFSVSPPGRARFFPEISSVSLTIVKPGVGEVRGLTRSGINSRWGPARRSPRDRACWVGEDFRLCVY